MNSYITLACLLAVAATSHAYGLGGYAPIPVIRTSYVPTVPIVRPIPIVRTVPIVKTVVAPVSLGYGGYGLGGYGYGGYKSYGGHGY
ncbi:unnamed protein product [Leptidea sinapis]|uniref:Uncharacterized protein n=1 Tax=Leptidea sinapis TaxID=189913 RepID=A0A5E4QK26_9NEOP|nr:unnamed protein product [Leptidea sinapis]